jgi:hypothetical protein
MTLSAVTQVNIFGKSRVDTTMGLLPAPLGRRVWQEPRGEGALDGMMRQGELRRILRRIEVHRSGTMMIVSRLGKAVSRGAVSLLVAPSL